MKRWTTTRRIVAGLLAACLLCCATAEAKKGGNGGGGGGEEDPPPRFTILELPIDGDPWAISESTSGTVTVAVDGSDEGRGSAAFVHVDPDTLVVLDHGFLPEPFFRDRETGDIGNGPSSPRDVNDFGTIVGYAWAYDAALKTSPGRGIVWTVNDDGTGYSYELLPALDGEDSTAMGINNLGVIVGTSSDRAVLWDDVGTPGTLAIKDLNTGATADQGWELTSAIDINDAGLIVGTGMLGGKMRGFLLDYVSKAIFDIPLVGPADSNPSGRINAYGRVIGNAWNGTGRYYGTNPDYVVGYSWAGPLSDPVVLPPVTDNTSMPNGLNDLGATVGNSFIPTDDFFSNYSVPTLWEFDDGGQVIATDLETEIENSRSWLLSRGWDVNNAGWISVYGRKQSKGRYHWLAVLLIPNEQ
jgi:hypothetical protein